MLEAVHREEVYLFPHTSRATERYMAQLAADREEVERVGIADQMVISEEARNNLTETSCLTRLR